MTMEHQQSPRHPDDEQRVLPDNVRFNSAPRPGRLRGRPGQGSGSRTRSSAEASLASSNISYEHLQACYEDGDLDNTLSCTQNNIIIETDDNGDKFTADIYEQQRQGQPMQHHSQDVEVLNDGGDTGPAELQNSEVEDETYKRVVHFGETSNVALENAIHAAAAVNTAVDETINATNIASDGDWSAQLCGSWKGSVTKQSNSPPLARLNNQGTSATINKQMNDLVSR